MSSNNHRRCAKCGKTRAVDMAITYHRFPKPRKLNIIKALMYDINFKKMIADAVKQVEKVTPESLA